MKFAVIGDSGRGWQPQYEIAAQMAAFRQQFKFPFVIMTGDNIYEGPATAEDYRDKFEQPYQALLDEGVRFYAVLGNHDDPRQVHYKPFNMGGNRYYTFRPPEDPLTRLASSVRFFAIDTTSLDDEQVRWIGEQLRTSDSDWKICFSAPPVVFRRTVSPDGGGRPVAARAAVHHSTASMWCSPATSTSTSARDCRTAFSTSSRAERDRCGGATRHSAPFVARAFDEDYHFMLVEIDGDVLYFQAISRTGETVDSGALSRVSSLITDKPPRHRDTEKTFWIVSFGVAGLDIRAL